MDYFLKKLRKNTNETYDPYKDNHSINEPSVPVPNKPV